MIEEDRLASDQEMHLDALVAQYAHSRSPRLREEIVLAATPLVHRFAAELAPQGLPREDLIQVGYLGLLNAIEGFNPARGLKFETYARPMIRGEMLHFLRDHTATIRRPRWFWRINRDIERTVNRHLDEHQRFPSLEELGEALNISPEGLREVLRARQAVRTTSLDAADPEVEIDRRLIRRREYASFQLPIEDRITLYRAIETLTEAQRKVLYYLFFRGLSQTQVARIVGTSQRQVSRVLESAIARLRTLLAHTHL